MAHLYQIILKPITTKYAEYNQSFLVVAGDNFEAQRIGKEQIEKFWSDYYEYGHCEYIANLATATNGDVFNIVG